MGDVALIRSNRSACVGENAGRLASVASPSTRPLVARSGFNRAPVDGTRLGSGRSTCHQDVDPLGCRLVTLSRHGQTKAAASGGATELSDRSRDRAARKLGHTNYAMGGRGREQSSTASKHWLNIAQNGLRTTAELPQRWGAALDMTIAWADSSHSAYFQHYAGGLPHSVVGCRNDASSPCRESRWLLSQGF